MKIVIDILLMSDKSNNNSCIMKIVIDILLSDKSNIPINFYAHNKKKWQVALTHISILYWHHISSILTIVSW